MDKEGDSRDEIAVARGLWEHVCKEMSVVKTPCQMKIVMVKVKV